MSRYDAFECLGSRLARSGSPDTTYDTDQIDRDFGTTATINTIVFTDFATRWSGWFRAVDPAVNALAAFLLSVFIQNFASGG